MHSSSGAVTLQNTGCVHYDFLCIKASVMGEGKSNRPNLQIPSHCISDNLCGSWPSAIGGKVTLSTLWDVKWPA